MNLSGAPSVRAGVLPGQETTYNRPRVPLLPIVTIAISLAVSVWLMSAIGPELGLLAFLLLAGATVGLLRIFHWLTDGPEPWELEQQVRHSPRTKSDSLFKP